MSDKSLEQFIASLKAEAIDTAENASKKILDEAGSKAKAVLEDAMKKKRQIIAEAEKDAENIVNKGKIALQLAARDLTLSVQNDLIKLFEAALENEIRKEFRPGLLKSVITTVIENVGSGIEIKLPKDLIEELGEHIHDHVQKTGDDVSFSGNGRLHEGMKITKTDQGWSYDITPEAISEALMPYLTANWIRILKESIYK